MKTPLTTRFATLAASIFVTFTIMDLIANYALPAAPAIELAQAAPRA